MINYSIYLFIYFEIYLFEFIFNEEYFLNNIIL